MIEVTRGIHSFVSRPDYSRLHQGFPPGGPQDRFSCRLANHLLGNPPGTGAIELALAPATLCVLDACHMVLGGAPCKVTINGQPVSDWKVLSISAGSEVQIRLAQTGCRVYVCVAGGLERDYSFAGDPKCPDQGRTRCGQACEWEPELGTVRVLPGPDGTEGLMDRLQRQFWKVAPQSSGMGLRLSGQPLALPSYDIVSAPVQDGTVQATANGLIALLRCRGTLGGYPRIANVIDCDVDRLAQFRPGGRLRFIEVNQEQASHAHQKQMRAFD